MVKTCAACGCENSDSMGFCGECGAKLVIVGMCQSCGHQNAPGVKFCGSCGGLIGSVSSLKNISLKTDKDIYKGDGKITVSVSGITEGMRSASAFVAIYKAGAGHGEYGSYKYPEAGSCQLEFELPDKPGNYEMRLYSRDGQYDDTTFVIAAPFNVSDGSDNVKVTLNKGSYVVDEEIVVSVSGFPEIMRRNNAYIAVHKKGTSHSEYQNSGYPDVGDSTIRFTIYEPMEYEIRLYRNCDYDDAAFVMSVPFTVGEVKEEPLVCASCGFSNPPGMRFCNECGAKIVVVVPGRCPACGYDNAPERKFCGGCGGKL